MQEGLADRLAGGRLPSRAFLSSLPVRIDLPSGLKATAKTRVGCWKSWPTGRPVAASQSRAVLSKLPVRMVLPSGLNATLVTRPSCRMG